VQEGGCVERLVQATVDGRRLALLSGPSRLLHHIFGSGSLSLRKLLGLCLSGTEKDKCPLPSEAPSTVSLCVCVCKCVRASVIACVCVCGVVCGVCVCVCVRERSVKHDLESTQRDTSYVF